MSQNLCESGLRCAPEACARVCPGMACALFFPSSSVFGSDYYMHVTNIQLY